MGIAHLSQFGFWLCFRYFLFNMAFSGSRIHPSLYDFWVSHCIWEGFLHPAYLWNSWFRKQGGRSVRPKTGQARLTSGRSVWEDCDFRVKSHLFFPPSLAFYPWNGGRVVLRFTVGFANFWSRKSPAWHLMLCFAGSNSMTKKWKKIKKLCSWLLWVICFDFCWPDGEGRRLVGEAPVSGQRGWEGTGGSQVGRGGHRGGQGSWKPAVPGQASLRSVFFEVTGSDGPLPREIKRLWDICHGDPVWNICSFCGIFRRQWIFQWSGLFCTAGGQTAPLTEGHVMATSALEHSSSDPKSRQSGPPTCWPCTRESCQVKSDCTAPCAQGPSAAEPCWEACFEP